GPGRTRASDLCRAGRLVLRLAVVHRCRAHLRYGQPRLPPRVRLLRPGHRGSHGRHDRHSRDRDRRRPAPLPQDPGVGEPPEGPRPPPMIESGPAVAWAQSRSKTNLAAAMKRTMMKIRATDRVLSFASHYRDPR